MTAHTLAEAYADAAQWLAGRTDVLGNAVALLHDAAALLGGEAAPDADRARAARSRGGNRHPSGPGRAAGRAA